MNSDRTVRIFLSSTFRDFGEERDLLVKRVFPALRARLKDRFVELVDVDLRWGITAEQAERGEVLPICLAEIDRARPYFIGMLGERYGWIPPSDGFAPDLIERQPWLKKHQGGKSVTELEILHGVLNNRRMKGRAFFYFRSPAYARTKGGDYLPSAEDRTRQTELKRRIRERGLPVTPYANPQALAKRIERDLWRLLDAEFPATSVPDAFERERLRHEAYAAPKRRLYLGGERYQAALAKLLEAEEPRIVVEGASGGGKSALLANFLESYRKRHPRHLVHEHYLGASTDAADPNALVRRLIGFIQRATGSTEEISDNPQKLMDSLPIWLATASAWARKRRTRFVFVLDALNSLTDQQDLRWWPAFLPKGVTMLVSSLSGPVMNVLKGKTEALPGQYKPPKWKIVTVRPMTKAQSATLLNTYLARFNKKLSETMIKQVQAHQQAINPLFLRTLAEELRLFGVHEELQKRLDHCLTSRTVEDLFERVLQRVEKDCGKTQVKAVLTAIWASRAGLTEKEILDIGNLKPATWAPIRYALEETLMEVNGKIIFANDYLRIAVRNRYLPTQAGQQVRHRILAQWFREQPVNSRRAEEEPYQWWASYAWRSLVQALTHGDLFLVLFRERPNELRSYWVELLASKKFSLTRSYQHAWTRWQSRRIRNDHGALEAYLSLFLVNSGSTDLFAESLARISLTKATARFGINSRVAGLRRNDLATLLQYRGEYAEAEKLFRKNIANGCFTHNPKDLAKSLVNLGLLLKSQGLLDTAKEAYRDAMRTLVDTKSPSVHQDIARIQNNLAAIFAKQGEASEAVPLYQSALAKLTKAFGPSSQEVGIVCANYCSLLLNLDRAKEAEEYLSTAMTNAINGLGFLHPDTAHIANNLASAKYYQGKFQSAAQAAAIAYKANRAAIGLNSPQTLISAINYAVILTKAGRLASASSTLMEVALEAKSFWASPNLATEKIIISFATMLAKLGKEKAALGILEQWLTTAEGGRYQTVVDTHTQITLQRNLQKRGLAQ
jgi:tetratricopeptide (TPR) repeat protein